MAAVIYQQYGLSQRRHAEHHPPRVCGDGVRTEIRVSPKICGLPPVGEKLRRGSTAISDRNGYPGTRFNTRYPGTRVALSTRLDCEISKGSVFMYRLRLFKVTHVPCLVTPD